MSRQVMEESEGGGGGGHAKGKRAEPRQLLRIMRKKAAAHNGGLTKLELRWVSYQPAEATTAKNDADVASAALANLFTHFLELRGNNHDFVNAETDPVTQNLLLRMENDQLKARAAHGSESAVDPKVAPPKMSAELKKSQRRT